MVIIDSSAGDGDGAYKQHSGPPSRPPSGHSSLSEPPPSPAHHHDNRSPSHHHHDNRPPSHHASQELSSRNVSAAGPAYTNVQRRGSYVGVDGRRASYASVDSSHSSGSYHSSASVPSGMRRSPSLPLKQRPSSSISEMGGARRVVSVIDQQMVVAPEHVTNHVTGHKRAPEHVTSHEKSSRKGSEHVSNHMTGHRRHSTSDTVGKTRRRHQYDHVRVPHPYEDMGAPPPTHPTPITPSQVSQPSQQSQSSQEGTITSPNSKRWKNRFLKRDGRPKNSPAPKRTLNASDSKLSRFSKKHTRSTNSPASSKRHSVGDILDQSLVGGALTLGSKHREPSPEGQLQAQLLNRYFPTEAKAEAEDVKEQVG